jgi:hypothetical protein
MNAATVYATAAATTVQDCESNTSMNVSPFIYTNNVPCALYELTLCNTTTAAAIEITAHANATITAQQKSLLLQLLSL